MEHVFFDKFKSKMLEGTVLQTTVCSSTVQSPFLFQQ
jgi:hypothetical protein